MSRWPRPTQTSSSRCFKAAPMGACKTPTMSLRARRTSHESAPGRPSRRPEQRDHTGLPWGLLDRAAAPGVIVEGNWIVVGSGAARAVAQIADAEGNVVRVRPPCPAQSPGTNDFWGTSLAERPHNPGRPAGLRQRRGVDQPPAGRRCIPRRLVRCLLGQFQQLCGLLGGRQSCVRQNHRRELREHRRPPRSMRQCRPWNRRPERVRAWGAAVARQRLGRTSPSSPASLSESTTRSTTCV